jgi:hypothetical protein
VTSFGLSAARERKKFALFLIGDRPSHRGASMMVFESFQQIGGGINDFGVLGIFVYGRSICQKEEVRMPESEVDRVVWITPDRHAIIICNRNAKISPFPLSLSTCITKK